MRELFSFSKVSAVGGPTHTWINGSCRKNLERAVDGVCPCAYQSWHSLKIRFIDAQKLTDDPKL